MARAHRRREAEEALAFERERTDSLREEIERLVAELEGPKVDEQAFARMAPEDAELVRGLIQPAELPADEGWAVDDGEELYAPPDPRVEMEEEIVRLEAEIADGSRRQEALERYLEALG
jgi:hypothetical protein